MKFLFKYGYVHVSAGKYHEIFDYPSMKFIFHNNILIHYNKIETMVALGSFFDIEYAALRVFDL